MKRSVSRVLVAGCLVAMAASAWRDGEEQHAMPVAEAAKKKEPAKIEASSSAQEGLTASTGPQASPQTSPPAEGTIVYSFAGEEDMRAFAGLWQQRQGIILRLQVLQAYANEENMGLTRLNTRLAVDYKLDTTKNYTLNTSQRVLIQHESQPVPPGPELAAQDLAAQMSRPPGQ